MSTELPEIPFNAPAIVGREMEYIRDAVERGHASGDGAYTRRCAKLLEEQLGVSKALMTTSCTDALEMSALLLDIQPGDEVIVPAFAFVSTINAFVLRGAQPRFADVRGDTMNLDPSSVESLISPRTRAIVALHYAGVGCEMDRLGELSDASGAVLVEDNAHGLFARYRGRYLGTFGRLATQSFHETKNFTCGEGGALLLNDPGDAERAEILRDKGTDRRRFHRGLVDKYTWVDLGSSFLLSDLLAAYLFAQLEERELVIRRRKAIWEAYDAAFRDWSATHGIQVPTIPEHCEHSYHMYYLVLPSLEKRQQLIAHLSGHRLGSAFHYTPLHRSSKGRALGGDNAVCPVTERISDCLLRLPFYNDLRGGGQQRVIDAVHSFFRR